MPIPIRLYLTTFGASLLAAATINITTLTKPQDADPIAALNECIQQRFLDRMSFGMSRVLPNRFHGVRQFHPENPVEQKVLTDLRQKGYQVAMFLVGRYALDAPTGLGDRARFGLQGPAFMTSEPTALPDYEQLLADGRKALTEFADRDGYDIRKGEWTVAMRPLRATSESCVQCHTSGFATLIRDENHRPHLGDALGVAMYVYRKSG